MIFLIGSDLLLNCNQSHDGDNAVHDVLNLTSSGDDLQTVLMLYSAFLCFFSIFGLASLTSQ